MTKKQMAIAIGAIIDFLAIVKLIYDMYGLYPETYGPEVQKCFIAGFLAALGITSLSLPAATSTISEFIQQYIGFTTPTTNGAECLQ
jgi:hypothetical protein